MLTFLYGCQGEQSTVVGRTDGQLCLSWEFESSGYCVGDKLRVFVDILDGLLTN